MRLRLYIILFIAFCTSAAATPLDDGDAAMKRGDFPAAIQAYRLQFATDSTAYPAAYGLARALAFSGHFEEAIATLSSLLNHHPNDADALLIRGRVLAWLGKFAESAKDLIQVTSDHPQYADAWSALGDIYLWNSRPNLAIDAYTKCIDLKPDDTSFLIARAKAFRSSRDFTRAREDLRVALLKGGDGREIDAILSSLSRLPMPSIWSLSISFDYEWFTPSRTDWRTYKTSVRRDFNRGSVALGFTRVTRFGLWDKAVYLDSYSDLWHGAYGNLFVQFDDAVQFLPKWDYMAEIVQNIGRGFEASAGFHEMRFDSTTADLYMAAVGYYYQNWYLRDKFILAPHTSHSALTNLFSTRWYYASVDDYLEATFSLTHQPQASGNQTDAGSYMRRSFTISAQRFFWERWGLTLTGGYGEDSSGKPSRNTGGGIGYRF